MFTSEVITYLLAIYFQTHVHSHRERVMKSTRLDRSYLEHRLFGVSQISILPGPDLVVENDFQKLFSTLVNLGILNCFIFAIYFGYKNVWYYSIILFFGSIILSSIVYAIIQRWPLARHLPTLLSFLVIPITNCLFWFLN